MSEPLPTGSRQRRRLGSGDALLAISILLPSVLFGLAAWQSYNEVAREVGLRIERTVRVLREHAVKVFETHALVLDHVRDRQRYMNPDSEADQVDLHLLLRRLQTDLDQVQTLSVTDTAGNLAATSRAYPFHRSVSFADRDWFVALKEHDQRQPFVSRSYAGRQSGSPVFNLATRGHSKTGEFAGAIAVSVDRSYFEGFYQSIEPTFASSVALVRQDGALLARFPPNEAERLDAASEFRRRMASAEVGSYETRSRSDGVDRMFGFGKIGEYPVFVRFGITRDEAFAPWRRNLIAFGAIALLASLTLLGVSAFAIRQGQLERLATERWRDAAAALEAQAESREAMEEQLRHAHKMEAIGQLTGGIAHDFNNLLTGIVGSLDLLSRRLRQGRTGDLDRYLQAATSSANRAAALTHRLLAFARRQPLAPKTVDANALVTSLDDLLRRTLGEAIGLRILTPEDTRPILCDPHQLESAILNLAINARDAMPDGGRLTISTANTRLEERDPVRPEVKPGRYVCVSVTDTGIGMGTEVMARAFEPFFTTKPLGQGTGLGLSMIHGFAHQSGGYATIDSVEGRGTTVRIYLPCSAEDVQPEARGEADQDRPEEEEAARTETVLVIEDEPVVRELVVEVVQDLGLRAFHAVDGPSGLSILASPARIDLLVSDVGLPGLNGRRVADEARRTRPDLKVLLITGYADDAALAGGVLEPGMELMTKPFSVEALAKRIREMIDG